MIEGTSMGARRPLERTGAALEGLEGDDLELEEKKIEATTGSSDQSG